MKKAVAVLSGKVDGVVYFEQESNVSPTRIKACFTDLPVGKHGFHIHEYGDRSNGCTSAGAHFNPFNNKHGSLTSLERHIGDMGNVESTGEKNTNFETQDRMMTLSGEYSVVGRSIVIHENEDDLGLGGHDDSETTGHSGPRLACGVIGWASNE